MNIAIIGTGNVGGTLAKRFARVGHTILLGSRNPNDGKITSLLSDKITAHPLAAAVQAAEIIIIATPAKVGTEVSKQLGDLVGKIVIDATNAIFGKPKGFNTVGDAILAFCNTKNVVKCFNTTGFNNMENPDFNGERADMFVAGDSKKGKETATKLAQEIGFGEVYDLGGNEAFTIAEEICRAWVTLARNGYGRDIAFKILKR